MAVFDIATAAARLGIDETEVCRRITDGTLTSLRTDGGRLCVLLDPEAPGMELAGQVAAPQRPIKTDAETIAKLRADLVRLEGVCAALRDEVQRSQRRLMAAQQREVQLVETVAGTVNSAA